MRNVTHTKNCKKQNKNIFQKARILKYNVIIVCPLVKMRIMLMMMINIIIIIIIIIIRMKIIIILMMMTMKKNEIYMFYIL